MSIVLETLYDQPIIILGFEGNINADNVLEGYMRSMELESVMETTESVFRIVDLRAINAYHDDIVRVIRAAVMITSSAPKQPEESIVFVGTEANKEIFSATHFHYFTDIDSAVAYANRQILELSVPA